MTRGFTVFLCGALAGACSSGAQPESVTTSSFAELDAGLVARGAVYVRKRGCPQCHQSPNASDGVLSGSATPLYGTAVYPPNLTPDADTGLGAWTDDDIARAIRDGFAPGLEPLCIQMSRFDRMGDAEVEAIIAYLRRLPAVKHAVPPSICPPIKPARDE